MIQQDEQQIESSAPGMGPGEKLQAARIAKGMTLEDVANKMHLSTCILTYLEENDFSEITAPIFVKGYLRAYSRLVGIDENMIIQQYSTDYIHGDPPISSISNTATELSAADPRVRWMTYLVVLGLIALLSTWWWNRYQQAPQTVSLESSNPALISSESASLPATDASRPKDSQSVVKTRPPIKTIMIETDASEAISSPIEEAEPEILEAVEILEPVVERVAITQPTTEPMIDNTVDSELQQPTVDDVESEGLSITVNADTWASIKDADGNKLIYDLLRSGTKKTVNGRAPISIFLGNGYGVSMRYQGKDIDLSNVIKPDNTARLKIGQ